MSEWFHVGQKVVCIHGWTRSGGYGDEIGPVDGSIYTVRELVTTNGVLCLRLVEVVNRARSYSDCIGLYEPCFDCRRFRPLRKRTTDISIFQAMLVTPPKEVVDA